MIPCIRKGRLILWILYWNIFITATRNGCPKTISLSKLRCRKEENHPDCLSPVPIAQQATNADIVMQGKYNSDTYQRIIHRSYFPTLLPVPLSLASFPLSFLDKTFQDRIQKCR